MKTIHVILSLLLTSFCSQINAQNQQVIFEGSILTAADSVFSSDSIRFDVNLIQADGSIINFDNVAAIHTSPNHYSLSINQDISVFTNTVSFDVIPVLESAALNGVSTLDLVETYRHILGIEPFNELFQLIAADVSGNTAISASDLVQMRRMILNQINAFPNGKAWQFMYKEVYDAINADLGNFNFQVTPSRPFQQGMFTYSMVDFIVIKSGDVNNTFAP